MKRLSLRVDSKGRIQIPKDVRRELGIKDEVSASIEDGGVRIEPIERLFALLLEISTVIARSIVVRQKSPWCSFSTTCQG